MKIFLIISIVFSFFAVSGCKKKSSNKSKIVTIEDKCKLYYDKMEKCIPIMVSPRKSTAASKKKLKDKFINNCITNKNLNQRKLAFGCASINNCKEFKSCLTKITRQSIFDAHKKLNKIHKLNKNSYNIKLPVKKVKSPTVMKKPASKPVKPGVKK